MSIESTTPTGLRETLQSDFPPISTEAWLRKISEDLRDPDGMRRLAWQPSEGFSVRPFYRMADLPAALGDAPSYPHGASTNRNRWQTGQDFAPVDPSSANRQARDALHRGADAVGFVLSLTAGAPGVLVRSPRDLEHLLDGIALDRAPIHLRSAAAPLGLLALLVNAAERQGIAPSTLQGSVVLDPVTWLLRTGALPCKAVFSEAARLIAAVRVTGASLHTLQADAHVVHDAGASIVQELAFVLAVASEYFLHLARHHVPVDEVCTRLRFRLPVGTSHFMEIAKLRALRTLFPQLVQAYEGAGDARPYLEAVTSRRSLTRYDPHVNMLRATTAATAAALGGCDELTIRPYDSVSGLPTDFSLRIARNTQLLLKHEAHLDVVIDPAAGSYYLEILTDELARHAWSLFQSIEQQGGLFASLENGFLHREIADVRAPREHDIATGRRRLVGTNAFPDTTEMAGERGDNTHNNPCERSLEGRFGLTRPQAFDALRQALSAGASLEEVTTLPRDEALLSVAALPGRRDAEPFEALRRRTEQHVRRTGRRPRVFLLPIGPPAAAHARATFSRNALGCAGYEIIEPPRFASIQAGARAAHDSEANLVVLCSADTDYTTLVPALVPHVDAVPNRPLLFVAGYPADTAEALQQVGVDGFLHGEQNLLETLEHIQDLLDVQIAAS